MKMVAISFSIFKDKLLSGEKDQTIRPFTRQRYLQFAKAREVSEEGKPSLQIYWKQRTKESEKLFDAILTELRVIAIDPDREEMRERVWMVADLKIPEGKVEEIVKRDGFESKEEFFNFFRKKYGSKLKDMYFILIRFRRAEGG